MAAKTLKSGFFESPKYLYIYGSLKRWYAVGDYFLGYLDMCNLYVHLFKILQINVYTS